jgi:hypothetical protein
MSHQFQADVRVERVTTGSRRRKPLHFVDAQGSLSIHLAVSSRNKQNIIWS